MLKKILLSVALFACQNSYCQSDTLHINDTADINKWQVSGLLLLTNNAFAPIPAFSFDNPALMAFLTLKKERFKFEPDISVGLNGKPWIWNNWFKYTIIKKRKFAMNLGLNPGLFFKDETTAAGEQIIGSHRNLTGEFQSKYHFSEKINSLFTYRFNKAFDIGTLNGHSIDFATEFSRIASIRKFSFNVRPQIFYFDSEGIFKGFYIASSLSISHTKLPVVFSYHAVQSVWTNYLPDPKYLSNFSAVYIF